MINDISEKNENRENRIILADKKGIPLDIHNCLLMELSIFFTELI